MITRKKFLSLSSLGIFSLLFPNLLFTRRKSEYILSDLNTLLKSASNLRKQKKYNQANQIYQQIIVQYPNDIRAYDGMRKILLSQKNKEWQVILMFKSALLLNPNNVEFKQRLYKEYLRAALGNKKIKNLINFGGRLLSEVKQKYENFVQTQPNNKNLQKQYIRINKLLEWNADTQNPNQNLALRTYKKQQYKNFKNRFDSLTATQLEAKLNKLLAKPYSKDRKQHIRELYKHSFKKLRKNKENSQALDKALTYYNTIDKNDPLFLKYIRDLSKYQKKHDILISIETQNHTLKNNFWSALALIDAYIRKAEHQNSSIPSNVSQLISFLEAEITAPNMRFEFNTRKIKLDILANQLNTAKDKILNQCKDMYGISNTHSIDRMNILIADYCVKSGNNEGKNKVLSIAVNPQSYIDNSDMLIQAMALMNQNRNFTKNIHIENLQKLIHKL
ncbi:hypothetical protein HHL23_20200 [Chryseobacterium sp. RP-3-3]|uniref:Tetratricopeptide repeat protein n=1 Tax=Chryseobacterium antibioticum TaxID=2728847 RepID=A0A7Y0ARC6_9FLAO|nr:tetratricopeptide repeat protein [Chryseobacterium antibioticum]NML72093.1 hypothetical protein [Chryseobacterium antibioticum]